MFYLCLIHLLLNIHQPDRIHSTETLIAAMQRKYAGKWAKTVTFTQHNTHYAADTVKETSVWYEAIQYPDKFRIDFGEPTAGNAVIFAGDSVFNFTDGKLKTKRRQPNNLILLAGGIYFINQVQALQRIREAGYNPVVFHEDTWQGKPAYVVGAGKGDTTTAQFWIDRENLYLVRTITPQPGGHVQEAHFSKHIRSAGGWIETNVLFLQDGAKRQLEEYRNVQPNVSLPVGLFDAAQFGKIHWKK